MRKIVLTTVINISAIAGLTPALTAEPTQCFEVISTTAGLIGVIKLNKCTGETWLMRMVNINGGTGLRWFPLQNDQREPVITHCDVIGR